VADDVGAAVDNEVELPAVAVLHDDLRRDAGVEGEERLEEQSNGVIETRVEAGKPPLVTRGELAERDLPPIRKRDLTYQNGPLPEASPAG
jgi:hypothetical protein